MEKVYCDTCGKEIKEKNTRGLNKKLLGMGTPRYYCMEHLSSYLGIPMESLLNGIEAYKAQGCKLFE